MMIRNRRIRKTQTRRRVRFGGLTLPELILSVAGIALVGLGVSSMLTAVAYGTSSSRDMRSMVVKSKAVTNRFAAAIRGSATVLETGDNYIVLWTADTNGDALPNVGEMRLIELIDGDLSSYKADWTGMTDEEITTANISYALDSDFATAVDTLKGEDYFVQTQWAENLDSWTIALDDANEQAATVIGFSFTYSVADLTDTAIGTAALRN